MKKFKRLMRSWLVRRLVREGRRLSGEGRFYEARSVYKKIVLMDSTHEEARAYVLHFDWLELFIEPKRGQGGTQSRRGE